LIKWRSTDRAEGLIVVFNHNAMNLYFTQGSHAVLKVLKK